MIGPTLAPARSSEPRSWGLWVGVALFSGLVALVVLGPLAWDTDPTFESFESLTELGEPLDAGAVGHPLGTDQKGRDVLARLLHAGRLTLLTALASVGLATIAGLLVGLVASNSRRFLGSVLMRFTDLGLAIQGLLQAAAISTVLGRGTLSLVIGLAAVFWAPYARVTYGQAVVLREGESVVAARVQGGGASTRLGLGEAVAQVALHHAHHRVHVAHWQRIIEAIGRADGCDRGFGCPGAGQLSSRVARDDLDQQEACGGHDPDRHQRRQQPPADVPAHQRSSVRVRSASPARLAATTSRPRNSAGKRMRPGWRR